MNSKPPSIDRTYTRRQFLIYQAIMETGTTVWTAMEAVATTAIEHPEWDMDEEMTWSQWEAQSA